MSRRLGPALLLLIALPLGAAEDAAVAAARAALAAGQPAQAAAVLRANPGLAAPGAARALLARAWLELGDPAAALTALGIGDDERLADWPAGPRGEAARTAALARIATGADRSARRLLAVALADGGSDDLTCLVLAAELAAAAGERPQAAQLARAAWNRRPRLAAAAPAGLLLARLADDELQVRALLAEVRALPEVAAADRLAAAELLCRTLLAGEPGACLVVAEQELARARAALGRLPLLRALALAALDPGDGLIALSALPPELAAEPAAQSALSRLRGEVAAGLRADLGQRLERARAAVELQRWDEARALVGDAAASAPAALALLARLPDADLGALAALPTARDAQAALALGAAFVTRGDTAAGWAALAPALAALDRGERTVAIAPTLHWACAAARSAAPDRVADLEARLRALPGSGAEIGEAWGRQAERLAAEGAPAGAAWLRAAQALPDGHPWRWPAAAAAAHAALAGDGDVDAAAAALTPALDGEADDERLRCRFLLAQLEARRGRDQLARTIVAGLRAHADPAQTLRLERFLATLP